MQDTLSQLLDDLLAAAVAALEPPNTDAGAPDRQFVSHGPPVADCAQLAVHWADVTGRPLDRQLCAVVPWARLIITLYRCVTAIQPGGKPPSAATLTAENGALAVDGWALWRGISGARKDGSLFPGLAACPQVDLGTMTPVPPSGGIAGLTFPVSVQISTLPGVS